MRILKLFTHMKISGATEMLKIFKMSLTLEEQVILRNHELLIQTKMNNV